MKLPEIAKQTIALYFQPHSSASLRKFAKEVQVEKDLSRPHGVFVTLTKGGETRACWGSIFPQYESAGSATVYATLGALTKDYRFKPIAKSEMKKLKPQVTVIRAVEPVTDSRQVNPFRDGVMVRSGGKSGVILPGEATDAHYEVVLARLKAGIKSGEPFQLYRLKADIYD